MASSEEATRQHSYISADGDKQKFTILYALVALRLI
jgi:hypothetical protein